MGFRFLKIKNAPIIVSEFYGESTFREFEATFIYIEKLLQEREEPKLFWLIDMRQMQLSYVNIIRVLETAHNRGFLSNSASRLIPISVAKREMGLVFKELADDRYAHFQIPFFTDIEQAWGFLNYIIDDS